MRLEAAGVLLLHAFRQEIVIILAIMTKVIFNEGYTLQL